MQVAILKYEKALEYTNALNGNYSFYKQFNYVDKLS